MAETPEEGAPTPAPPPAPSAVPEATTASQTPTPSSRPDTPKSPLLNPAAAPFTPSPPKSPVAVSSSEPSYAEVAASSPPASPAPSASAPVPDVSKEAQAPSSAEVAASSPPSSPSAPIPEVSEKEQAPPSSSSPSPPTVKPTETSTIPPSARRLIPLLRRALSKTDNHLLHLSRLLATPRGIDVSLCTLSYTLQLLSALTSRYLEARLSKLATSVAASASDLLLPGETLLATVPAPRGMAALEKFAACTKALYSTISDFRIFVRLWGLLGLYTWARSYLLNPLPQGASRKDKIVRAITGAEIASLIAFQVLENGAYLSSKGVLAPLSAAWAGEAGKRKETKWWVWSCRFWAAYVVLEGVRLGALWKFEKAAEKDDGEKEAKIAKRDANRLWWRDAVSNLAYFPMTLHWSVEQGVLSDVGVGLCGIFAGGANLVDAWRGTA